MARGFPWRSRRAWRCHFFDTRHSANKKAAEDEFRGSHSILIERWRLLLGAENGILGGLSDAELHDLLGRDLDLFAGRGIAADAGLAVDKDQLADARNGEAVLGLFVGQLGEGAEEFIDLLLAQTDRFGER